MSCTAVQTYHRGDGTTTTFSFAFQYHTTEDVTVYLYNETTKEYVKQTKGTQWSLATATTITFVTAPPTPTIVDPSIVEYNNILIKRDTDVDPLDAEFFPGSAIRAEDLNNNFEQLQFAIQENACNLVNATETADEAVESIVAELPLTAVREFKEVTLDINNVTTSADGAMSKEDKAKLDGISSGSRPGTVTYVYGNAPIVSDGSTTTPTISITNVTTSADGAMSKEDKQKLDNLTPGANVISVTGQAPIVVNNSDDSNPVISISPATTSAAGSLSAADKAKLDRIQFNTRRNTTFTTAFDGVKTDYTLTHKTPNSAFEILLTVGGIVQQPNVDFTYNSGTGVVSFAKAPPKTAPYAITFNSVLTSELGQAAVYESFLSEPEIQAKLDLAATAVDAKFDQLRVAIDEATDFDTLKARLLAVLQ